MTSEWHIRASAPKNWRSPDFVDCLELTHDNPKPNPGPRSALVRIYAVALNARDKAVVARDPIYPIPTVDNLIPGADGAGIIEAVGAGSQWHVGDKVFFMTTTWVEGEPPELADAEPLGAGNVDGTLREYGVFTDPRLVRAPNHLSFEELAALPAAAGTAMNALFYGPLQFHKGMYVLTQGTGGVSAAAIQLAAAAGAVVIATSSSAEKLATAKQLGARHLINYREVPNWADEVRRITNGKGVDHVVDVCGPGTLQQSLRACRRGGLVSLIGFLADGPPHNVTLDLVLGAKTLRGVNQVRRDMMEAMAELVQEHEIHPAIGKIHEFEDAKGAFRTLAEQSVVGKIVVRTAKAGAGD